MCFVPILRQHLQWCPQARVLWIACNWSKLQLQTVQLQWQLHILLLVEIIGQTGFSIEPIKNQAGLAFCDEVQLSSRLYSDHH